MTDEEVKLLEYSARQVLLDTEEALLRPTGDIAEGTAPAPQEFKRCLEYYCAVNAKHHTRYRKLYNRVMDLVFEGINGPMLEGHTNGTTAIATWAANHGTNADKVREVLEAARKLLWL